jgi:hypothetical protein
LTNWVGDDGWLAELDLQLRGFNYHGDIHRMTGSVTGKGADAGNTVEVAVLGTNQRDDSTVRGTAKLLLPTRTAGAVVLPTPDEDLQRRGAQVASRMTGRVGSELRELDGE